MNTKIMLLLAFAGFASLQSEAQQCLRPAKKTMVRHASRVATVKKSKPVKTAMVSPPFVIANQSPVSAAPVGSRCVVGADGDITHCMPRTWTGGRVVIRNANQPRTYLSADRRYLMSAEQPGTVRVDVNTDIDYSMCAPGTCTIPTPFISGSAAPGLASGTWSAPGTPICSLKSNGQVACASSNLRSGYYNPDVAFSASDGLISSTGVPGDAVCSLKSNGEVACSSSSSWSGFYPSASTGPTSVPADAHCSLHDNGAISCHSWSGYKPAAANSALAPRFGNSLVVSSSAFLNNSALPTKYTCEGEQITPPLTVENVPEGTRSLAVMLVDANAAPNQTNTYWMAWNITSSFIPEAYRGDHMARNPYSKYYGYTAVCPVDGEHQYHFKVFALDKKLNLSRDADRGMFEQALSGHVLASGEIVGTYNRLLR